MAVVSEDHASITMSAERVVGSLAGSPRLVSVEELEEHNKENLSKGSFWAVVDGYVVDVGDFLKSHPGGNKKLLSVNQSSVGYTGLARGFSFSRGRNAHFPRTAKVFQDGVRRYLNNSARVEFKKYLPPVRVEFPPHGSLSIVGKIKEEQPRSP